MVLFTMALESEEGTSVWAYVELGSEIAEDAPRLEFASLEEMDSWVDARFEGREAVFTLAREGRISSHWGRQQVSSDLLIATEAFLDAVIRSIKDAVPDPGTRLRAKIVGVDAARSELPEEALKRDLLEVC